ncbi:MAG TPA: DUF2829 domain-containing protein [Pseudomonas sp.]
MQMRKFIGTAIVQALPMTLGEHNAQFPRCAKPGDDPDKRGYLWCESHSGPAGSEHVPTMQWSAADAFERIYRPARGLTFGQAIEAMRAGSRVARAGWNGKDMWLTLVEPAAVLQAVHKTPNLAKFALQKLSSCGQMGLLPCIAMKTANDEILMGWKPSDTDMLGDDWTIVT